ncbi:hypothetical protein FI667_g7425, partial [Globisporangium splendens]
MITSSYKNQHVGHAQLHVFHRRDLRHLGVGGRSNGFPHPLLNPGITPLFLSHSVLDGFSCRDRKTIVDVGVWIAPRVRLEIGGVHCRAARVIRGGARSVRSGGVSWTAANSSASERNTDSPMGDRGDPGGVSKNRGGDDVDTTLLLVSDDSLGKDSAVKVILPVIGFSGRLIRRRFFAFRGGCGGFLWSSMRSEGGGVIWLMRRAFRSRSFLKSTSWRNGGTGGITTFNFDRNARGDGDGATVVTAAVFFDDIDTVTPSDISNAGGFSSVAVFVSTAATTAVAPGFGVHAGDAGFATALFTCFASGDAAKVANVVEVPLSTATATAAPS